MDGVNPFSMRTGTFTWYNCRNQFVAGESHYSCKSMMLRNLCQASRIIKLRQIFKLDFRQIEKVLGKILQ